VYSRFVVNISGVCERGSSPTSLSSSLSVSAAAAALQLAAD